MALDPNEQFSPVASGYATPEQLQSLRMYGDTLTKQSNEPVQHWTQGAANIVRSIMGGLEQQHADQLEQQNNIMSAQARMPSGFSKGEQSAPSAASGAAPDDLVGFVKHHEGYSATPYPDGKQTSIGWGSRALPGETGIDPQTAEARLQRDLGGASAFVEKTAPNAPPGVKRALTDLTYNAGTDWATAGLGNAVRSGDYGRARELFQQYNHAGGNVLPGLTKRRNEAAQWFDEPTRPGPSVNSGAAGAPSVMSDVPPVPLAPGAQLASREVPAGPPSQILGPHTPGIAADAPKPVAPTFPPMQTLESGAPPPRPAVAPPPMSAAQLYASALGAGGPPTSTATPNPPSAPSDIASVSGMPRMAFGKQDAVVPSPGPSTAPPPVPMRAAAAGAVAPPGPLPTAPPPPPPPLPSMNPNAVPGAPGAAAPAAPAALAAQPQPTSPTTAKPLSRPLIPPNMIPATPIYTREQVLSALYSRMLSPQQEEALLGAYNQQFQPLDIPYKGWGVVRVDRRTGEQFWMPEIKWSTEKVDGIEQQVPYTYDPETDRIMRVPIGRQGGGPAAPGGPAATPGAPAAPAPGGGATNPIPFPPQGGQGAFNEPFPEGGTIGEKAAWSRRQKLAQETAVAAAKETAGEGAKALIAPVKEDIDAGNRAQGTRNILSTIRDAYNAGGDNLGGNPSADLMVKLQQYANEFLPPEIASQITGGKLQQREVVQKMNLGLSSRLVKEFTSRGTQMEIMLGMKNNPGLMMSDEGSIYMLNVLDQMEAQKQELGQLATEAGIQNPRKWAALKSAYYGGGKVTLDDGTTREFQPHPLLSPFSGKPLQGPNAEQDIAALRSKVKPENIPDVQGPDGQMYYEGTDGHWHPRVPKK